ncbi:hypothetical protein OOT46_21660 [Aquabacterium sp. A7-Y]|uniref:hypothetical protein n=1 Tax=Aquabacterium sp. A7-Y TaxID=1349605 RepID=UPI00223DF41E|nr:hypothetical protein [Aquabacterium sp. A7-Y]MCW7540439.1 hypothetical protein [Aquabacterium sp. A7-Y]
MKIQLQVRSGPTTGTGEPATGTFTSRPYGSAPPRPSAAQQEMPTRTSSSAQLAPRGALPAASSRDAGAAAERSATSPSALIDQESKLEKKQREKVATTANDIALWQAGDWSPNGCVPVGAWLSQRKVAKADEELRTDALDCKQSTRNIAVAGGLLSRDELRAYEGLAGERDLRRTGRDLVPENSPQIKGPEAFRNLPPGFAISFEPPRGVDGPSRTKHSMLSLGEGYAVGSNNGCIDPPSGTPGFYSKIDLAQPELWLPDGRFKGGKSAEHVAQHPEDSFQVHVSPISQFATRVKTQVKAER